MMIAYNPTGLDHFYTGREAQEACANGYITPDEERRIREAYPTGFYTPNVYLRAGLFLLTLLILLFGLGLLSLIVSVAGVRSYQILVLIEGCMTLGALEWLIFNNKHYRSGVDDALLLASVALIATGICMLAEQADEAYVASVLFCVTFLAALRYANRLMAAAAAFSLLALVFYITHSWWPVFLTSAALCVLTLRGAKQEEYKHYSLCLRMVEIVALLGIYAGVNYWAVRNAVPYLLHADAALQDLDPHRAAFASASPLGWFCWILTAFIPLFYLYAGIRWKERIVLWIGMITAAATVLTVRFYHSLLPAEQAMTIGGILLIGVAYGLGKYLRRPRYGISSEAPATGLRTDPLQLGSLVIAQAAAGVAPAPPQDGPSFGGGSFGGGGAGGDY